MAKLEEKAIEAIDQCYTITQKLSQDSKNRNFRCPVCDLNRIAKARTKDDDWFHTGCKCTYQYLSAHGLTIK